MLIRRQRDSLLRRPRWVPNQACRDIPTASATSAHGALLDFDSCLHSLIQSASREIIDTTYYRLSRPVNTRCALSSSFDTPTAQCASLPGAEHAYVIER